MIAPVARLTTPELIAFIAEAARELEKRAARPLTARPAAADTAASSPVVRRACTHCDAPVFLAMTEKNGLWIPLDEDEGNYVLVDGKARWVDDEGTHAFHYDRCPGSSQNQQQEPPTSLFDELAQELRLRPSINDEPTLGGGTKAKMQN